MSDPPAEDGLPSTSTPQNLADSSTVSTKSKKHKKRKDKQSQNQDGEPTTSQAPPSTADMSSAAPDANAETASAETSKEKKKSKKRKRQSQLPGDDNQTNENLPSTAGGTLTEDSAVLANGDGDAIGADLSQQKRKKPRKSKGKEQQNDGAVAQENGSSQALQNGGQGSQEMAIADSQPTASQGEAALEKRKRKGKKSSKKHDADATADVADVTTDGQDSAMVVDGEAGNAQTTSNEAEQKSRKKSRKSKGGKDAVSHVAVPEPASSPLPSISASGAPASNAVTAPSTSFAPSMPAHEGENDDFDMNDLPPPLSTPATTNGAAPPSGQSRIEPSDPSSSLMPASTQSGKGKKRRVSGVAPSETPQKAKSKARKSATALDEAQVAGSGPKQAGKVATPTAPATNGKKGVAAKPSTPANGGRKGKGKSNATAAAPSGDEEEGSEQASDSDAMPSVNGSAPNSAQADRPGVRKRLSLPLVPNKRPDLPASRNTPDNNEILATKWLNPGDLSDQHDLFFLTGRFSKEEDAVIRHYLHHFQQRENKTHAELEAIIFAKTRATRETYNQFWADLARSLTDRPLMSVFHHVKRMMAPTARMGSWTAEEDARLVAAVKQYGQLWETVSNSVGRWAQDCRDRWRNYLEDGPDQRKSGVWTKEEEDRLRKVVKLVQKLQETMEVPLTQNVEGEEDEKKKEIFWTAVSKKFGPTRSRLQCRGKWLDNMANRVLTKEGRTVRWSKRDQFIFVQKIASLHPTEDNDIEFRLLSDPTWNHWSGNNLSKRWHYLSTRAKKDLQNPAASTEEVVKYLKDEQDRIPRAQVKRFMAKAPGELESDEEDDDDDDDEELSRAENGEESNGEEATPSRQKRKSAKDFSKKLKPGQEYRTSEFVESSGDEEGEEEDADAEPDEE